MSNYGSDKVCAGSIPALYDTLLVPLIFEPYAADLAARLAVRPLTPVQLEDFYSGLQMRATVVRALSASAGKDACGRIQLQVAIKALDHQLRLVYLCQSRW